LTTNIKVNILGLNSETFSVKLKVTEIGSETTYHAQFDDMRMYEKFGTIKIVKGPDFWRIPTSTDLELISISFRLVEAIQQIETTE
jgi:hypothetical protein